MKRPNLKFPIAIVAGLTSVIVIIWVFSWFLMQIDFQISQRNSERFLTKNEFHVYQGIFFLIGGMIGAFITSISSPKHEISRTVILGVILIVIVVFGVIRSYSQNIFDIVHIVIYIFTIPSMWLIAYLVKKCTAT
jgi:hypothetical protein